MLFVSPLISPTDSQTHTHKHKSRAHLLRFTWIQIGYIFNSNVPPHHHHLPNVTSLKAHLLVKNQHLITPIFFCYFSSFTICTTNYIAKDDAKIDASFTQLNRHSPQSVFFFETDFFCSKKSREKNFNYSFWLILF